MKQMTPTPHWSICQNQAGELALWHREPEAIPAGWESRGQYTEKAEAVAALETIQSSKHSATEVQRPQNLSLPLPRSLMRPHPKAEPSGRLICFPHAGAGASSYHFLAQAFQDHPLEVLLVQYPGRESRLSEASCVEMGTLVDDLVQQWPAELFSGSYFFFGHSMGALTVFEVTHALKAQGLPLPQALFLSGRAAPDLPNRELPVDAMDDDAFLTAVAKRYNAIPEALLENRELLGLVLPSLRSDFSLMLGYKYNERPLLDIPAITLNGDADTWVSPAGVQGWQKQFRPAMQSFRFPGDHFYLQKEVKGIRAVIDKYVSG